MLIVAVVVAVVTDAIVAAESTLEVGRQCIWVPCAGANAHQ